ncbi:TetR/AcrR family transcriptional regulator [Radiobacillus kanasensis]|uniref:TetR/AcrR family transcriptional regulator n=1 Tax=Radiobacillus kanasensis TaxID=2844358 RepID=UPI001E5B6A7E|nr:TetR/AcrR family transcriptional regulator [Radiobacillus kanasensis]UFU01349.1 TetR/AcrR family transcriptional regulator [Radiobacillus kanasensis]
MESKEHLTNRQIQAKQTRNNIVEAGRAVFLKVGFQKATISQIIKEANTGYGTAYVYFSNKDELFIEIMTTLMNRFYEVAELPFTPTSSQTAHEMISNQVKLFLSLAMEERAMMQVVKEAIGTSEEVNKKWTDIRERFIERIAQDIQFAQDHALAKKNLDPHLVARGWFYSNEMFMWEIVEGSPYKMEDIIYNLTNMYTSGLYMQN